MSFDPIKNFSYGVVDTAPSPATTGTTLVLGTGQAARFPNPATEGPYNITVWLDAAVPLSSNAEIVRVTGVSTDTLTIEREQEGSTARTIIVGDQVTLAYTKKKEDDLISQLSLTGTKRQLARNGNLDVWQRGVSFTATTGAVYTADGFQSTHTSDGVLDVLRSTDVPTVAESGVLSNYSYHVDVTTADTSMAAGQFYFFTQNIEGYNVAPYGFGQSGTRYITISFWVKATKTGIYSTTLRNGAANRSYAAEYTVNTTDTWEKKTITIPVDTSGAWLTTNGKGLSTIWAVAAGSTFATTPGSWVAGNYIASSNQVNGLDSTANNFKIAQVQVNAGEIALPFNPKSHGEELVKCQRYCQDLTTGSAAANMVIAMINSESTTAARGLVILPTRMRIRPVIESVTPGDFALGYPDAKTITNITASLLNCKNSIFLTITSSGLTANRTHHLYRPNTTSKFIIQAEL